MLSIAVLVVLVLIQTEAPPIYLFCQDYSE